LSAQRNFGQFVGNFHTCITDAVWVFAILGDGAKGVAKTILYRSYNRVLAVI
jgi:hypothetical protein